MKVIHIVYTQRAHIIPESTLTNLAPKDDETRVALGSRIVLSKDIHFGYSASVLAVL